MMPVAAIATCAESPGDASTAAALDAGARLEALLL